MAKNKGKKAEVKESKKAKKGAVATETAEKDTKKGKKDVKAEKAPKADAATKSPKAEIKGDKKASAPKAEVKQGLYLVDGKLVPITWEQETAKKVTANSEVHSDAPLFKDRVFKHDEKVLNKHNDLVDKIAKLEEQRVTLLDKAGKHFA